MHTGTLIHDLLALVERAERSARAEETRRTELLPRLGWQVNAWEDDVMNHEGMKDAAGVSQTE